MKQWHIAGKAKRDLAGIRRFTLEQWGHQKAEEYLKNLYGKIQLIAENPTLGIDCSKSLNLDCEIRSIVCTSHIIYYIVSEAHISVVAVLHQSMVPKKHLLPRL